MNPAIQLLLSHILLLIGRLHANPAYQVHSSTSGHVQLVEVRIYAPHTEFNIKAGAPKPIARAQLYWRPDDHDWLTEQEKAEALVRTTQELEFLRAALFAYLPVEAVSELEAAA